MQVEIMRSKEALELQKDRPESAASTSTTGGGKNKKGKKKQQDSEATQKAIEDFEARSKNVEEEINQIRKVWEL